MIRQRNPAFILVWLGMFSAPVNGGETIPEAVQKILSNRCLECHDALTAKSDVNLEHDAIDWAKSDTRGFWEHVFEVVDQNLMPPKDEEPLTSEERQTLMAFLDQQLLAHTPIGGTLPRRLSKSEYEATIRDLTGLRTFQVPLGFPGDNEYHGFDNVGEGLVLSATHLEAYSRVAGEIADSIFPPTRTAEPEKKSWTAGPDDMVLSFSAATVHGEALRLVSRSNDIMRSCTWPSRIEICDSGTYQIAVEASKFVSDTGHSFDGPMILEVYARPVSATDRSKITAFRLLREIEITSGSPAKTEFQADLYTGETVLFRWKNAEMTHDNPVLGKHFESWMKQDPRFLAAWLKATFPSGDPRKPNHVVLRGRNGWDIISKNLADPDLDLSRATMDSEMTKRFLKLAASSAGTFNLADALCHFYHENGPALEFHSLAINGPLKLVESPTEKSRRALQDKITGPVKDGQTPREVGRQMLTNFLPRAFRRPVDDATIETFMTIADRHWNEGHDLNDGLHLLLRNILISPRFLYRNIESGEMDDSDLATRLSYFLTQRPPDATLLDLGKRSRLSITKPAGPDEKGELYWVIEREANRLLPKKYNDPMIQDFVGQWLDTATLDGIMPDPKFKFDEKSTGTARLETERFFAEMLTRNLPMTDFIDPDFTFTSVAYAQRNYGFTPAFALEKGAKLSTREKTAFRHIKIERGGRYGGLLGQSAILMATANGVDTQPVIRGVWVLENILGMPPPEPPQNIPALTPDTRGATTPRELLAAHTSDAACAGCHQRIDPIGFVLENYDPVGRWRTEWPGSNTPIDASTTLFDGTKISNAMEFKAWLVENIDLFSQCLSEKLMTYATGRVPNYAERHEISQIVQANHETGNGFRDLVLALTMSETFRTR